MTRIGIFADVQNIYYTTRDIWQRQFDYRRLWQKVSTDGEIVIANAYAIEPQDGKQQGFQKALKNIGFEVKLKPYLRRHDGSAKGDWDVGITIDIIEAASRLDVVILLSGDGDFSMLLDHIRAKNQVTTVVYGVQQLSANGLIQSADQFYAIDQSLLQ